MKARMAWFVAVWLVVSACGGGNASTDSTETARPVAVVTTQLGETSTTLGTSSDMMILEITVFDWTESVPPGDVSIGVGFESWQPDLEFGGDVREFGEYQVGVPSQFEVYPDGIGGMQIVVEFVMTDEMISGSPMSLTNVEIYDNEILVSGQAIPGFEAVFDR